jgi:hypothetical protein
MTNNQKRAARFALISYITWGAFSAGIFASAMPALSWPGVIVAGVTAPVVVSINKMGGHIAGVDFVPPPLQRYMFDFDERAQRVRDHIMKETNDGECRNASAV